MWPDRGGGTSDTLPAAVVTGRVVFQSASGEACCVAVDPTLLSPEPGQNILVLDDLAPGPATVTVAGFATDFAPAVPGITETCKTVKPEGVMPCDGTQTASPSFESVPLDVNIIAGAQINLGTIDVSSLPFVLQDFTPAEGGAEAPPVQFDFTVADAVTGVAADSVALDVTVTVPDEKIPNQFRSLTKRIPLTLDACADGGAKPCSPQGDLQLAGFKANGVALNLPEGPAEARITAQNLADPVRDVDFRYIFTVLPEPSETPTAVPPSETPTAGADAAADTSTRQDVSASDPPSRTAPAPDDPSQLRTPSPPPAALSDIPTPTPTATP